MVDSGVVELSVEENSGNVLVLAEGVILFMAPNRPPKKLVCGAILKPPPPQKLTYQLSGY
jgi:hypothetical protein